MGLLKARIFQNSLFKQAKWLVSAPEKAYKYLLVSEAGEIGIGMLPMPTGFLVSHETRRVWRMISYLSVKIKGVEGRVLPLGERSYVPLDPNNQLAEEDKQKFAEEDETKLANGQPRGHTKPLSELDSIAKREHDKAMSNIRNSEAKRQAAAMFKTAMIMCGLILLVIVIWSMIKK